MILCELLTFASFYHTFIGLELTLEQITKLYVVTIISTTGFGVLADIVDVGGRKDKCILSAVLYSIAMASMFFGKGTHFETLMLGRVVYGAASALHHSSFEAYVIHEHTTLGFPDIWLSQTFGLLVHAMGLVSGVSGTVGQIAASSGPLGCPGLCCTLFIVTALYLGFAWGKDNNTPRFLLSGFMFNLNQTMISAKSNRSVTLLLAVSSLCEASIMIFTFYWAPWITSMVSEESLTVPYEIVYATYVAASILGNYIYQMYSSSVGSDNSFQAILIGSSGAFLLGAVFQTPSMAFLISIVINVCVGGYWPSIGFLRGRHVAPELRTTSLTISRVLTVIISVIVLNSIHHSPMLMLTTCAALNGAAAYFQFMIVQDEARGGGRNAQDDEEEGDAED